MQRKTQRPVQFELTEPTRAAVAAWIEKAKLEPEQCLFPSRHSKSPHVSTRQYARVVHQWIAAIGLDSTVYGTHTMRRTKATLMYKHTKNLKAVQILLGHTKLESTVRYLGIEVDDALEISELRIPAKLDSDSTASWTRIPDEAGQSERSDAGFWVFTLLMSSGSSFWAAA